MSQFAEDSSASYLKKAKSNSFAFYAKMENKPVVGSNNNNNMSQTIAASLPPTTALNSNTNTNNSSLHKTLAAFYNHAPPSLPRNFLPPLELSERISVGFDLVRNRVLEIRMLLSKFNEEENAEQRRKQNDATNCNDENDEFSGLNRKERRRRQRELEEQKNNNYYNVDQLSDKNKNSDKTHPVAGSSTVANVNYSKLSLIEATARRIFSEKTSLHLFQSGIVPQSKEFDISKWIAFLFHDSVTQMVANDSTFTVQDLFEAVESSSSSESINSVDYSATMFRLQPKSTVSLIARLTPGMSNALVEAICSKFSKIANSKETVRFSINNNDETKINNSFTAEICVEPINLPENSNGNNCNLSSPMMGIRTQSSSSSSNGGKNNNNNNPKVVEGLIRFLALLRHSGLGCWLYSALCGVELPLSTAVRGCLQEILRICCTSLKTLFEVRPDLLNKVTENVVNANEEQQQQQNNNSGSKFVASKLLPPLEIEEATGNNIKNTKFPSLEIKIQANGIDFLSVEDARALITIIVLIGKCFNLANPALLPL